MIGEHLSSILQIIMVDLALAGDNAVVIGAVASRAPAGPVRRKMIAAGIAAAIALRIAFAASAGRSKNFIDGAALALSGHSS